MVRRGSVKLSLLVPERPKNHMSPSRRSSLDTPHGSASGQLPHSSASEKTHNRQRRTSFGSLERSLSSPVLGRDFQRLRDTWQQDASLHPEAKADLERHYLMCKMAEHEDSSRRGSLAAITESEDEPVGPSGRKVAPAFGGLVPQVSLVDPCTLLSAVLKAVQLYFRGLSALASPARKTPVRRASARMAAF